MQRLVRRDADRGRHALHSIAVTEVIEHRRKRDEKLVGGDPTVGFGVCCSYDDFEVGRPRIHLNLCGIAAERVFGHQSNDDRTAIRVDVELLENARSPERHSTSCQARLAQRWAGVKQTVVGCSSGRREQGQGQEYKRFIPATHRKSSSVTDGCGAWFRSIEKVLHTARVASVAVMANIYSIDCPFLILRRENFIFALACSLSPGFACP